MRRQSPFASRSSTSSGVWAAVALSLAALGCAGEAECLRRRWMEEMYAGCYDDEAAVCRHCNRPKRPGPSAPAPFETHPHEPAPIEAPPFLYGDGPEGYSLDAGDELNLNIEGVPLPLPPAPSEAPDATGTPQRDGIPVEVRPNGSLELPLLDPVPVRGLTVPEAEARVRKAYAREVPALAGGKAVRLTLRKGRTIRVLVLERSGGDASQTPLSIPIEWQRGSEPQSGRVVELRGGQSDVARALIAAGALPQLRTATAIDVLRLGPGDAPPETDNGGDAAPRLLERDDSGTNDGPSSPRTEERRTPRPLGRQPARLTTIEFEEPSNPTDTQSAAPAAALPPAQFQTARSGRYAPADDYASAETPTPGHSMIWTERGGGPDPEIIPHWVGSHSYRSTAGVRAAIVTTSPAFAPPYSPTSTGRPTEFAPRTQSASLGTPMRHPRETASRPSHRFGEPGERPALRIPLRLAPGETRQVSPQDVVLRDGDVVCVQQAPNGSATEPQSKPAARVSSRSPKGK